VQYLELGIDRLILGSIALRNPEFVKEMAAKYPIVVGIDAINGYVAVEGWGEVSSMRATDLAKLFANAGVEAIICTDVGRDGTLSGVNVDFTLDIARACGIPTIASGGVKDDKDIETLLNTGEIAGVIVGKAFYEGRIDLKRFF
jgi:phosphoribosylformimino-5-aminoimidazole carboxamide ribotide isomerase